MFKKRSVKTSATKRRTDDDALETESVTTIVPTLAKKQKLPSSTSKSSPEQNVTARAPESSPEALDNQKHPKEDMTSAEPLKKVSGPKGAPKNVRVTTLTDFQPDVCKDFQQTGYCGYGDTCKFLHIRDELKARKPVEKEWETVSKGAEKTEEAPFKCVICRNDYSSPVQTLCGHTFCRSCFMQRFKAGKLKCVVCKRETGGSVQPTKVSAT